MQKQNPNVSDADLERVGRITKSFGKVSAYISPLFILVGMVIVATVLWGACRLMGGQGQFLQALSVTLYAWIPRLVIGGIIGTVIIMTRGTVDPSAMATVVKSSPAFLVDMKEQPVLYSLLASFDLFAIWTVILLIIGFAAVSKLSKAKTAAIVITLWFVTVFVKLGFAALGAARMKG
ncbi:MAG: YIP1 family protein, partial [Thermoanaerobaculia bacterium]